MRIEIKTKTPVKNPDLRALYLLVHALENVGTQRMKTANLRFVADRLGYRLIPK